MNNSSYGSESLAELSSLNSCPVENEEVLYATFLLDDMEFAIATNSLREAVKHSGKIIALPSSPHYVEGIINLRGSIIPVINLKKRFDLKETKIRPESKIAITKCNGVYFGMLFDDINEVIRVKSESLDLVQMNGQDDVIISGILNLEDGKRIIQIVDTDSLARIEEIPSIAKKITDSETLQNDDKYQRESERQQNLTFFIDDQEYGVDINTVQEIIKMPEVQKGILSAEHIEGVITLRGSTKNVINLRKLIGKDEKAADTETRLVILRSQQLNSGIIVDSIGEVGSYIKKDVLPVPSLSCSKFQNAVAGILEKNNKNITLLNIERLFSEKELGMLLSNVDLKSQTEEKKNTLNHKNGNEVQSLAGGVYISFMLDESLVVEINCIQEIIKYTDEIITLPGEEQFFSGILNLRGKIIPIVNLRSYYGLDDYAHISSSKIMILSHSSKRVGIIVDEVTEIVKMEDEHCYEVPQILCREQNKKFEGHVEKVIQYSDRDGEKKTMMIFNTKGFIQSVVPDAKVEISANPNVDQALETVAVAK